MRAVEQPALKLLTDRVILTCNWCIFCLQRMGSDDTVHQREQKTAIKERRERWWNIPFRGSRVGDSRSNIEG